MRLKTPLVELEIIGYSDALSKDQTPHIVPPVYRNLTTGFALVPAFTIKNDHVEGGYTLHMDEVRNFEIKRQVTLFSKAFAAQFGHTLWIDEEMQHHYEPEQIAHVKLKAKAIRLQTQARAAFAKREFEAAQRLAGQAISADNPIESWALILAVHRLKGESDLAGVVLEYSPPQYQPQLSQLADNLIGEIS